MPCRASGGTAGFGQEVEDRKEGSLGCNIYWGPSGRPGRAALVRVHSATGLWALQLVSGGNTGWCELDEVVVGGGDQAHSGLCVTGAFPADPLLSLGTG